MTVIGSLLGTMLAREHGGFDDRKATRLTAALDRSREGLAAAPAPRGP